MQKLRCLLLPVFFSCILLAQPSDAQDTTKVERERDVIYHKFEGVALTMDVFKPADPNGVAIIKIVSGGWKSNHRKLRDNFSKPYTDHGYTVFAVIHGSQPRYKVRDIMGFMHRAVRFIRKNADRWEIDPNTIGVTGSSAGGHLSLILATKGAAGDPKAKDPVDRVSSAVQATAVFYPPTDYRNWAEPGDMAVGVGKQSKWQPAFGPESETPEGREALGRHMSSIYHVSKSTAPVFIVHGDADEVVPLHQATSFQKAAREKGAMVEVVIKEGGGHGWPNRADDEHQFVPWFDSHLRGKATSIAAPQQEDKPSSTANTIPTGLAGDWSLDLESKTPAWMRIVEQDGKPKVFMRIYIGSTGPHKDVELIDGRLKFQMKKKRKKDAKAKITYVDVGIKNGLLDGIIERELANGKMQRDTFTGTKIPPMPQTAPDLSKVKFGKPVTLFNGKDMTGWVPHEKDKVNGWSVQNGLLKNTTPKTDFSATGAYANLKTEAKFEDFRLHIEFLVEEKRNSGVYLRGMYEAQVVDRDSRMQGIQGVGAIFNTIKPTANAGKPGGEWQTYDITLVDRHFTVVLNGQKVIDNQPASGPTAGAIHTNPALPGPIYLQGDHTNVTYRNIVLEPVIKN